MEQGHTLPKILLIGAGRFGIHYLELLQRLHHEKKVDFKGVIVKTDASVEKLSARCSVPVSTNLSESLLQSVDAVMIVTPPETHYDLVKRCLQYTHVLVEKPFTDDFKLAEELTQYAKEQSRFLMVGHVFRFHPVAKKAKRLLAKTKPYLVQGKFINPIAMDPQRHISFELLHLYDILDFLFDQFPERAVGYTQHRIEHVSLRYPGHLDAHLDLGWAGQDKQRSLDFYTDKKRIFCDFQNNLIKIFKRVSNQETIIKEIFCTQKLMPLDEEVLTFLNLLKTGTGTYPSGDVGARIVKIVQSIVPLGKDRKPKIAIIGSGIFGTNCAIEFGKHFDVTLFERHDSLLKEASFVNQYRHHMGHHYPRSVQTVKDIIQARGPFEALYEKALIKDFPTYYCVAKEGSRVSGDEYIQFCQDNQLPFTLEYPDVSYVNRDLISTSIKTFEFIYNYPKLHELVTSYLATNKNILVKLNSEVINCTLEADGRKRLTIKHQDREYTEDYDFVINVTYADINKFAYWLQFPIKLIRIDLVQALIVKVPIPKISFAIMDGPFTNMVPTADDHLFTLVHIKDSMLYRGVPKDGLIPKAWQRAFERKKSNTPVILNESQKWLPILSQAEVIESRYVFRSVNAYMENTDARPSDIIPHGFGCWSIMGGKIINSVLTAQQLAAEIHPLSM